MKTTVTLADLQRLKAKVNFETESLFDAFKRLGALRSEITRLIQAVEAETITTKTQAIDSPCDLGAEFLPQEQSSVDVGEITS